MTHQPSTMIYEPSETGAGYVAVAFNPDGELQARRSFDTRAAAEAFLQAFMQENAGEFGLVNTAGPVAAAQPNFGSDGQASSNQPPTRPSGVASASMGSEP